MFSYINKVLKYWPVEQDKFVKYQTHTIYTECLIANRNNI